MPFPMASPIDAPTIDACDVLSRPARSSSPSAAPRAPAPPPSSSRRGRCWRVPPRSPSSTVRCRRPTPLRQSRTHHQTSPRRVQSSSVLPFVALAGGGARANVLPSLGLLLGGAPGYAREITPPPPPPSRLSSRWRRSHDRGDANRKLGGSRAGGKGIDLKGGDDPQRHPAREPAHGGDAPARAARRAALRCTPSEARTVAAGGPSPSRINPRNTCSTPA